ncbi:hypothetical protein AAHB37_13160 [Glutamicibacter halophytocola]|uniref:hypothetical protein n=1 Tax=Glutamicibacter halophytocola TaxID=1933880 RepID=UPI00321ABE4A
MAAQRGLETYGVQPRDELWEQPGFARPVIDAWSTRALHAWSSPVPGARHKLRIRGVLGQSIMADSGDGTTLRLLDAAELKTRQVDLAEERGEFREEQSALF